MTTAVLAEIVSPQSLLFYFAHPIGLKGNYIHNWATSRISMGIPVVKDNGNSYKIELCTLYIIVIDNYQKNLIIR